MPIRIAAAALALAALSFVHLFGVEKAVMAAILGVIALKEPELPPAGRKLAKAAIFVALAYLLIVCGVFLYHMPTLNSLASKLGN